MAFATGVLSGVVVIDADSPETVAEMEAAYGRPAVRTRQGGHWYFRHPRNGKATSNKIKDKLDRKGDGGYVVAPPSRDRTWTNGMPDRAALPVLPRELWPKRTGKSDAPRTMAQERKERAADVIACRVAGISGKGRHEHLTHLCGVLLSRNVSRGGRGGHPDSRLDEDRRGPRR